MGSWGKSIIFAFCLLAFTNLVYLDIKLFFAPTASITSLPLMTQEKLVSPTPLTQVEYPAFCPETCLARIRQATESLMLVNPAGSGGPSPTSPPPQVPLPKLQAREFYIPFGTGKTTSGDWEDIKGTDTTIDTSSYGRIKEAYFEANIYIPTGNGRVTAQLYNVTDKHPVWFAEVSTDSDESILLRSGEIVLDKGSKVYRVRLKSSLGAEAVMDFARVKIVVE